MPAKSETAGLLEGHRELRAAASSLEVYGEEGVLKPEILGRQTGMAMAIWQDLTLFKPLPISHSRPKLLPEDS